MQRDRNLWSHQHQSTAKRTTRLLISDTHNSTGSADVKAMLAQHHFVRALVRSLLRGADGEDDVVQNTWLRAMRTGPNDQANLRPWLGRIARNLSLDHLRNARRRRRHERDAGSPEAVTLASDVLQREGERGRMIAAVLALPQPYRNTVLLRFWNELSPTTIAKRLGVPSATVRSQLKRGLAMLREQLDADFGSRRDWVIALSPFAGLGQLSATTPLAAILMSSKLKTSAVAAVAILIACVLGLWLLDFETNLKPDLHSADNALTLSARQGLKTASTIETVGRQEYTRREVSSHVGLTITGRALHKNIGYAGLELTLQVFEGYEVGDHPRSEHKVKTDSRGEFRLLGERQEVACTVRAIYEKATARVSGTPVVVMPNDDAAHLDLTVIPHDCLLRGFVHDTAGKPIVGAHVKLARSPLLLTDADGRFAIHAPRGREFYSLDVYAEGFAQVSFFPNARLAEHRLHIGEHSTRKDIDVLLLKGASMEGRVIDDSGTAIADATVRVNGISGSVQTDANGSFRIHGAWFGTYGFSITARKSGYAPTKMTAAAGDRDLQLVLRRGLSLEVRVVDAAGDGIAGATIEIFRHTDKSGGLEHYGFTRGDGRIELKGLTRQPLIVCATKHGFFREAETIDPRDTLARRVIQLERGQFVEGHVLSKETGRPIVGAGIGYGRVVSDSQGKFRVLMRDANKGSISAHHPAFMTTVAKLRPDQELILHMRPAPSLAGRVVDGVTGRPIKHFTVRVQEDPKAEGDPRLRTESGRAFPKLVGEITGDGYWRSHHWRIRADVDYHLHVGAEGYAASHGLTRAKLHPSANYSLVKLYKGTTVLGTVRDTATGKPIADVMIKLSPGAPKGTSSGLFRGATLNAVTDQAGRFSISSVPAGPSRLALSHPDLPSDSFGPFEVIEGSQSKHVLPTMAGGLRLSGQVTGLGEAAGWRVRVVKHRYLEQRVARVKEDLSFEVTGIATALHDVELTCAPRDRRYLYVEFTDKPVTITFDGRAGTGSIVGDIRGEGPWQVSITPVSNAPKSEWPMRHTFTATGSGFTRTGLAPGRYSVHVSTKTGHRRKVVEVIVGVAATEVVIDLR